MTGLEGIAGVLDDHAWLDDYGCNCGECGNRGAWPAHLAAAVVVWVTDRLASDEVREVVAGSFGWEDGPMWRRNHATAALTAVTEALRGPS